MDNFLFFFASPKKKKGARKPIAPLVFGGHRTANAWSQG